MKKKRIQLTGTEGVIKTGYNLYQINLRKSIFEREEMRKSLAYQFLVIVIKKDPLFRTVTVI